MSAENLYDEVIRKHNTHPYHFEKKEGCAHLVQANNFICGDRFEICLVMNEATIVQAYFHGFGCAVSKASTSVLAKLLEGKSKTEALKISDQFLRVLKNEIDSHEKLFSNEFKSFGVVHEVPARFDCAALAWTELEKFLKA